VYSWAFCQMVAQSPSKSSRLRMGKEENLLMLLSLWEMKVWSNGVDIAELLRKGWAKAPVMLECGLRWRIE